MRFFSFIFFLAVPATVSACEGPCMVGITNAWLSNHTTPIQTVMTSMAAQVSNLLVSSDSRPSVDMALTVLDPIMKAYHEQSYHGMETAIFPRFFHGKCLDDSGSTPPGCPNPDCPVVCGTPGSLVHFFAKLRYIAFNQTSHLLQALCTPGTDTYQQVEKLVLAAASKKASKEQRRSYSRIYPRSLGGAPVNVMQNNQGSMSPGDAAAVPPPPSGSSPSVVPMGAAGAPLIHPMNPQAGVPSTPSSPLSSAPLSGPGSNIDLLSGLLSARKRLSATSSSLPTNKIISTLKSRAPDIKDGLKGIMGQVGKLFSEACGGNGKDTNGLPNCSSEKEMKAYILTFP